MLKRSSERAAVELTVTLCDWPAIAAAVGQPAYNCRLLLHRLLVSTPRSVTTATAATTATSMRLKLCGVVLKARDRDLPHASFSLHPLACCLRL